MPKAMPSSSPLRIDFYFDTISPYSYLAWVALLANRTRWKLNVNINPMFLGGVMNLTGNKPPAMLPARAVFQANDLKKNVALFGVHLLETPPNFFSEVAKKTLVVQRVIAARQLDGASQAEVETLLSGFFHAIHVDPANRDAESNDLNLSDELMIKILRSAGMNEVAAKRVMARTGDADVKAKISENTKFAVDNGAFGAPTMFIYGGKAPFYDGTNPWMVFGSDRFEQIAHICDLPYDGGLLGKPKSKM